MPGIAARGNLQRKSTASLGRYPGIDFQGNLDRLSQGAGGLAEGDG